MGRRKHKGTLASVAQKRYRNRKSKSPEELFPELVEMAFIKVWNELNEKNGGTKK